MRQPNPTRDRQARPAVALTPNLRELFRYEKGGRIRAYSLHALDDADEVWIASGGRGTLTKPKRRFTCHEPSDLPALLEDMERTLRAGGWRRLTP